MSESYRFAIGKQLQVDVSRSKKWALATNECQHVAVRGKCRRSRRIRQICKLRIFRMGRSGRPAIAHPQE